MIGAGAVIWSGVRAERTQRDQERRSALVSFYAASNAFGLMWSAWADMQVKGPLGELRLGVRMVGLTGTFLTRLWHVTDAFWHASGRVRAYASGQELEAVDAVEAVIAEWTMGEPMPASWAPAIRQVRAVLERRGDDLPNPPDNPVVP